MKTLILTTALVVLTTISFAQNEEVKLENDLVLNTEDVKATIFPNSNDMVTLVLEKKAGELVKFVAQQVGGGGGGQPTIAQAGGRDASKLDQALASVPNWLKTILDHNNSE